MEADERWEGGMRKVTEAKPLENYRVWVRFDDGIEGTVDLSALVGKGVFSAWRNVEFFNSVYVDEEAGALAWEGGIDLCPDNLYAMATMQDPMSVFHV